MVFKTILNDSSVQIPVEQPTAIMTEQLILKGTLEGHSGWVTSLATSLENPNMLLSGSRDKSLIIWNLTRDDTSYGYPKRSLHGHSHIVSDCVSLADTGELLGGLEARKVFDSLC